MDAALSVGVMGSGSLSGTPVSALAMAPKDHGDMSPLGAGCPEAGLLKDSGGTVRPWEVKAVSGHMGPDTASPLLPLMDAGGTNRWEKDGRRRRTELRG